MLSCAWRCMVTAKTTLLSQKHMLILFKPPQNWNLAAQKTGCERYSSDHVRPGATIIAHAEYIRLYISSQRLRQDRLNTLLRRPFSIVRVRPAHLSNLYQAWGVPRILLLTSVGEGSHRHQSQSLNSQVIWCARP